MEAIRNVNQIAHDALLKWQKELQKNSYTTDPDFIHSIQYYFKNQFAEINQALEKFGNDVPQRLEPLVQENNFNPPGLVAFNTFGDAVDQINHHPSYIQAGQIIYQTNLLSKLGKPGGLVSCLSFLFLSSQAGEAGHNCPIACSAGIIRVLQKLKNFPKRDEYLAQLTSPNYPQNYTGAQFLTELQGGSDVGLNSVYAREDKNKIWRIYGKKWFCSNAGADLMFVTARYQEDVPGTKGLGLFLVPRIWQEHKNLFTIDRLKDKIGTRSMATGEIEFNGAYAMPVGQLEEGFHTAMDNVLHLSRLFNTFSVLGMARRAHRIAHLYAKHRVAFAHRILDYPLVQEPLAKMYAENTAVLSAAFATANLQDQFDAESSTDATQKLLLRLLVNFLKYLSALWSVEHIHQALGVLAGNGAIETFSSIPRLLRDCIVCENWEGTHNVLRMQILKDMLRYDTDTLFMNYMQQEINRLPDDDHAAIIKSTYEMLSQDLKHFKTLTSESQSLAIQHIIDRMAILYSAVTLLIEAAHQQATGDTSKLHCFELFALIHLQQQTKLHNKKYLELIRSIN